MGKLKEKDMLNLELIDVFEDEDTDAVILATSMPKDCSKSHGVAIEIS